VTAMRNTLRARIRFLTVDEGGRLAWAEDGIRPQLKLGELSTSCVVRSAEGQRVFEPGVEYLVDLELMFWNQYSELLNRETSVVLLDGSRVIATGRFV
jgi:hypothetical protein